MLQFYDKPINRNIWQGGRSAESIGVSEFVRYHEGEALHGTYRSLAHRYGKGTARVGT